MKNKSDILETDYWFGGAEPEAYEVLRDADGKAVGLSRLAGVIRHTVAKEDGKRGFVQVVDSRVIAVFQRDELVFMVPEAVVKTHVDKVHDISSEDSWRPGES